MALKTRNVYEFGPFRLEPAEHRLTRENQQVPLPPKSFELLVYLVENHGRLVTKDQIMRAVWPGSFVEEANLTVSISSLRKVLGKDDSDVQYIETVPKRGYRFTASVTEVKSPEVIPINRENESATLAGISPFDSHGMTASAPLSDPEPAADGPLLVLPNAAHRRSWLGISRIVLLGSVLAAAIANFIYLERSHLAHNPPVQRSLAILPLRNLRHDPDNDFLGFSLADAVITKLGAVSSLTVRPSSAIEKYKGQTIDISKAAADLNVDTLLTGNFFREGDQLRITYQLVDVKTEKILGRDTIDLKYDKLLTVQDNVAQQIIKGLELNLSPSEARRIEADEPVNPLAYEYYLRGVDLVGSHDYLLAIKMLERSAEIDPNHALSWAYLGQSYTSAAAFELGGRAQYEKAQVAYQRALALQPKQLEASMFLANLLIDTGKVEQAMPLLRDALRNNPNNAGLHWELGYALRFAGMLKESVAECEHALQIDPLVKSSNGSVLNTYFYLGEYDKFLQSLPDENDSEFVVFYRGLGEYYRKNWDQAARNFERAYQLHPSLYAQIGIALNDAIIHKESEGLQLLHRVEDKIRQRGVGDPEAAYKIAQAYAVLRDKSSATRMLGYSIQTGFFSYPYFVTDPLLENIRHEPQFPQVMNIARLRYEAFRKTFF